MLIHANKQNQSRAAASDCVAQSSDVCYAHWVKKRNCSYSSIVFYSPFFNISVHQNDILESFNSPVMLGVSLTYLGF